MKLLTLNAHSLCGGQTSCKLATLAELILKEEPDLIALQESSQSADAAFAEDCLHGGMTPLPVHIPLRCDNHAAWCAYLLHKAGLPVFWAWLPVKIGYGRLDEGLALLSLRRPVAETRIIRLTQRDDYADWRTRKALGIRPEGCTDWFFSVHMGRWDDREEPFERQWENLRRSTAAQTGGARVWLMGDFNNPAEVRREGYDLIRADGWQDAWLTAGEISGGFTVRGSIDGWKDRGIFSDGMRIDHIWCSRPVQAVRARVVFDGVREPRISDHFGVMMEIESARSNPS